MNLKTTILWASALLLLSSGCSTVIVETIALKADSIIVDKEINATNLVATQQHLVIQNNSNEEIFHIYQLPELIPIHTFGKIGRADNEFITPRLCKSTGTNTNTFTIGDKNRNSLWNYEIKDSVTPTSNKTTHYSTSNSFAHNGKDLFCTISLWSNQDFIEIIDTQSLQVIQTLPIPKGQSGYTVSFFDNEILCASMYENRIYFTRTDQSVTKVITKETTTLFPSDNAIYYIDSAHQGKYFYLLYLGFDIDALGGNHSQIHVYTNSGELAQIYQLDQPITNFTIWGDTLYCTSAISPNTIYTYKIAQAL